MLLELLVWHSLLEDVRWQQRANEGLMMSSENEKKKNFFSLITPRLDFLTCHDDELAFQLVLPHSAQS